MFKVSVIMASYNHSKYIAKAIENTLSQSFSDFELIIIDDGSKDESYDVIMNYLNRDKRIKAYLHEKNQGIAKTVNEGMDRSTGEYLAFASSDDIWMENKLLRQVDIVKSHPNVVIWSDGRIIDAEGRENAQTLLEYYKKLKKKKSGRIFKELLSGNYVASQTLLFNRVISEAVRFREGLKYLSDYMFNLDMSFRFPFIFIDEPLFQYRIHGNNSIFRDHQNWEKDDVLCKTMILNEYYRFLSRKQKGRIYNFLSNYYSRQDSTEKCMEYASKAVLNYPFRIAYWRTYFKMRSQKTKKAIASKTTMSL